MGTHLDPARAEVEFFVTAKIPGHSAELGAGGCEWIVAQFWVSAITRSGGPWRIKTCDLVDLRRETAAGASSPKAP